MTREGLAGQVESIEFVRDGTTSLCVSCAEDAGGEAGDQFCCYCCACRDQAPGTYLTIRLDGDPALRNGRVVVTYIEGEVAP